MNYGGLGGRTNLGLGSGVEGYLAKRITDILGIPLQVLVDTSEQRITFALRVEKKRRK
jgi:hypothetical protein